MSGSAKRSKDELLTAARAIEKRATELVGGDLEGPVRTVHVLAELATVVRELCEETPPKGSTK